MNNWKKVVLVIIPLILLILFVLGIYTYMDINDFTLISESDYLVRVQSSSDISAKLYYIKNSSSRYLLVLRDLSTSQTEGYIVDLMKGTMGIPNFSYYRPFFQSAIVGSDTLLGFPLMGQLGVDIKTIGDEIQIYVKGYSEDAKKATHLLMMKNLRKNTFSLANIIQLFW